MKKLMLAVITHRRTIAEWWERYIVHEIEIASAVLVLLCDTLGFFASHQKSLLIVHQCASTGTLVFLVSYMIRKFKERNHS